jgi:hypothetical protein
MVATTTKLREYGESIQSAKEQPYVYFYRIQLSLQKHRATRRLLQLYVNHTLRTVQRRVDKMGIDLSIQSIMSDHSLTRHHYSILYALCRLLRPVTVIETGVGLGASTAFILQALKDNNSNNSGDDGGREGRLYSIDLPGSSYESDAGILIDEAAYTSHGDGPGCLVPEHLRSQWTLIHGRSEEELPGLCGRLGIVDLFFHDSEHTYENMLWEYRTIWPYIRMGGGVLASHDTDWNTAFKDFVNKNGLTAIVPVHNLGLIKR